MKYMDDFVKYKLPVLCWMGVIFWFSAQPETASGAMSGSITTIIFSAFDHLGLTKFISVDGLHHIIRKSAHFSIYFILGMLVYRALSRDKQAKTSMKIIGVGILICFAYACSDEIHQLFIDGRSGQIRDVLIDTSGALLGILLFDVVFRKLDRILN